MSLLCALALGLIDKRAQKSFVRKKSNEKVHPKDIKEFPGMFWLLVIICVTYYVTVVPFVGVAMYVYIMHAFSLNFT